MRVHSGAELFITRVELLVRLMLLYPTSLMLCTDQGKGHRYHHGIHIQ